MPSSMPRAAPAPGRVSSGECGRTCGVAMRPMVGSGRRAMPVPGRHPSQGGSSGLLPGWSASPDGPEVQVTWKAADPVRRRRVGAAEWPTMADDSGVPVAPVTALTRRRRRLPMFNGHGVTPFVEMDRAAWAGLAESTPLPLTADEIERLRSLGDPIDVDEVQTIYLPLSRLLNMYVGGVGALHRITTTFLGERTDRTPD